MGGGNLLMCIKKIRQRRHRIFEAQNLGRNQRMVGFGASPYTALGSKVFSFSS